MLFNLLQTITQIRLIAILLFTGIIFLFLMHLNVDLALAFVFTESFIFFIYLLFVFNHWLFLDIKRKVKLHKQNKLINDFVIIPFYTPPSNIHPAIAGFLIDKQIGWREFYSVIFNLILNGNVAIDERIINDNYDYFLIKNKGFKKSLSCDRIVSDDIFETNDIISIKKLRFNKNVISDFVRNKLIKLGYFEDIFFTQYFVDQSNVDFGNYYTYLGAQERAKWLGFKDYLQTAERFRMNEEKVETFSKYLPFAVALGVETEWTKRFENMKIDRLEWFRTQKEGAIIRHDEHRVYFKHLLRFMGTIRTIN